MNLADERLKELDNPSLSHNERALLRCSIASETIHAGRYEAARGALGELWRGIGERPETKDLRPPTAAEVLLRCGALSGWLGSAHNIAGVQERAKDLLSEARRIFKSQGQRAKVSEAQYELGMCYWRLGAYDEARVVLDDALKGLGEQDAELKAKILIRHTLVEVWTNRYHEALDILEQARPFFERCNDAIKGRWHGQMALVLRRLATAERRADYADRAIIEFTAAAYHLEQAKHERYCATTLNNLAMLLHKLERYREAHEYLDRASRFLERLQDSGLLAQVNETRARVLVAEQRYREANRVIAEVIRTFDKSGENALLADALTIQGVVWARLGLYDSSVRILGRAINTAQESGAFAQAGQAAITLIEEHGTLRLPDVLLYKAYRRADKLLKDTQDIEDITRLRECARIVTDKLSGAELGRDFSLPKAVLAYEARFIEQALELERGSVSRAAQRLGISHQKLADMLKRKHRYLLNLRTPIVKRRRSIIKKKPKP